MKSQGDLDSRSVGDISQHLSKWQCIYIPIHENWDQLDLYRLIDKTQVSKNYWCNKPIRHNKLTIHTRKTQTFRNKFAAIYSMRQMNSSRYQLKSYIADNWLHLWKKQYIEIA